MTTSPDSLRLLFLDGSPTSSASLELMFGQDRPDVSVCHCDDASSALAALHLTPFDALLVDAEHTANNNVCHSTAEFLDSVTDRQPDLPVIFLVDEGELCDELRMISSRSDFAIVPKNSLNEKELRDVIQIRTTARTRLSSVSISESGKLTPHDVQGIIDREKQFRLLFYSNPLPLFVYDSQTLVIKDVNTAALELYGFPHEQFTRLTLPELHNEEEASAIREQFTHNSKRILARGTWHHRRADGTIMEVEIVSHPFNRDGREAVIVFASDVTRQRRAEAELKEASEQHKTLFENSPLPMWVYEADTLAIVEVNAAATAHYGYTRTEFLRLKVSDLLVSHPRPEWDAIMEDSPRSSSVFRHRTKHGAEIDVEITASNVTFRGMKARLVTAQNVTDRLRAEAEVKNSRELYRKLIEENITALYTSKPDGTILVCNEEFARLFGLSGPHEAVSINTEVFFPEKGDREKFLALLHERKALHHHEMRLQQRDGTPLHVLANIVGRFDDAGNLTEIAGYMFDITERLRLEESLRQMQKMESIGTLAGGIAHDFNNILSIIHGNIALLTGEPEETDVRTRRLNSMEKAVERGARLVRQLLTFARKAPVETEGLNVNLEVRDMVRMLSDTFPKTIEVHFTPPTDAVFVEADRNQLHQALLNLCVNARDAILDGTGRGRITIATGLEDLAETRTHFHEATHPAYVTISVTDDGRGMDETTQARVFEPFFTTKERGTGLGLSVVYGVARSLQGYVHVNSTLGQGSTFTLHIPAAAQHCKKDEETFAPPASTGDGKETILVVEDEAMLMELVTEALQGKGYTVLTAADGDSGIEVFRKHVGEISLVVSDKGLPKQSGIDVFRQVKQLAPQTRTIIMSGYLQPDERTMLEQQGIDAIIEKPFLSQSLVQCVREVLDAK